MYLYSNIGLVFWGWGGESSCWVCSDCVCSCSFVLFCIIGKLENEKTLVKNVVANQSHNGLFLHTSSIYMQPCLRNPALNITLHIPSPHQWRKHSS